jgi:hypothetical protein
MKNKQNSYSKSKKAIPPMAWILFFVIPLLMAFSVKSFGQCSTPATRSNPTVILSTSTYTNGSIEYLSVGNTKAFYIYSNTFFVIENVTSGRTIHISTCGAGYDSQLTLRDWSTDTQLAYADDNGPGCTGTAASINYTGNSSYPHVKVCLNQFNCQTTSNYTYVTVTYVNEVLTPSDPTSISISTNPTCGGSTQLTANGAVGTVYWYTGGCGSTYIGNGNPINVSPSSSTTYYAKNYNNGYYSTGCASTTVTVNSAPGNPYSLSASASGSTTANISWTVNGGSPTPTNYWEVYTSPGGSYVTGSNTSGSSASVSGLSPNTAYYFRVYSNNSCGSSSWVSSSAFTTYPADPTSISASVNPICAGGSTTLTANGIQGTVYWYTGSCGGTYVNTGNTLVVSPASTTTYYARNYNGNYSAGCASVTITVNSTAAPTGTAAQSFCPGSTVADLTATGTTIQWYAASTGGSALSSSTSLVSGTHYYASQIVGGCESTTRFDVTVTLKPTAPTGVSATPSTIIVGSSSNLTATSTSNSINWYTASSGGTLLGNTASGANFSVSPTTTTTYYAEAQTPSSSTNLTLGTTSTYGATGVYFNISPVSTAISISGFNFYSNTGGGVKTIAVYYRNGTYSGHETAPGDWTLYGTFTSVGTANDYVAITALEIPSGTTYGFCLYNNQGAFIVQNGGGTIADSKISVVSGGETTGLFTGLYSGYTLRGGVSYVAAAGLTSCTRTPVTLTVNSVTAPTGDEFQVFCGAATVSDLVANGTAIKWYDEATGGTQYSGSDALVNGTHYYASQTIGGFESATRLDVTVTINPLPTITLSSTTLNVAAGNTSGNLVYTTTSGSPDLYSIDYDASAEAMGFVDVSDAALSGGQIVVTVPAGAMATDYYADVTVKNGTTGCVSSAYPVTINVYGFSFTTSKDIGTTLLLTWTQIPGIYHYTVQYRLHSGGPWIGSPAYTNNFAKLTNLQANTEYDCRIYIYKNGTFWSISPLGTFTTANVTYYKAQDIGTTAQLSWDNIATWAHNYTFQYRTAGPIPGAWVAVPAGNNTQVKLTNLLSDRDYDCRVNVYANGGLWGICQLGTFHTAVVSFNATQDIGTTLLLDWTSFAPWASAYTVQYRKVGLTQWTGVAAGGNNQVKLVNLLPDQDYECRVYVFKNNAIWGCSGVSTIHTGKVDFTTLADNGTSIQIEWPSLSAWASSNLLQYSLPAMTNWITIPTTTGNSVTVAPVLNGQDYYVRLLTYTPTGLWGVTKEQKIGRSAPGGNQPSTLEDNTSDLTVSLNLYPNPFAEQINLEITSALATSCTWSVYDITGKQVMSGTQDLTEGNNTMNIDASTLANGVYMLNAIMNNEKHSFRILKQ